MAKIYRRPPHRPGGYRHQSAMAVSTNYRGRFVRKIDSTGNKREEWRDAQPPMWRDPDDWISVTRRSTLYEERLFLDEDGEPVIDPITGTYVTELVSLEIWEDFPIYDADGNIRYMEDSNGDLILNDEGDPIPLTEPVLMNPGEGGQLAGMPIPLAGYNAWYAEYGDPSIKMNRRLTQRKCLIDFENYEAFRVDAIIRMQSSFNGDYGVSLPQWYISRVDPTNVRFDKRLWGRILRRQRPYAETGVVKAQGPILRWMPIADALRFCGSKEYKRFNRGTFRDDVPSCDHRKNVPAFTDMLSCGKCGYVYYIPDIAKYPGKLLCWNCDPWQPQLVGFIFNEHLNKMQPIIVVMRTKDAKRVQDNLGKPKEKRERKNKKKARSPKRITQRVIREELLQKLRSKGIKWEPKAPE